MFNELTRIKWGTRIIRLFWENYIITTAADALAPAVARPSAAMISDDVDYVR